jgi:hypothetical protein
MAHPIMFEEADPILVRLREICLGMPGADEKVSHGRPNFFTTRVFAVYGGVVKGDHDPEPHRRAVLVLTDPHTRAALLGRERFFVPGYFGPSGWVGLDLARPDEPPMPDVDWIEVAELVDASYRMTAPARLVRELDARG